MTPERWSRLQELFNSLADLSAAHREERLAHLNDSGTDPDLLSEVRRLLLQVETETFFLDTPVFQARELDSLARRGSLHPADVLADRFEILRFIGAGGMGEVYEAHDRSLGESVALKCLKSELARESGMTARFRQEVQLSRRVTHRNVCRIFDLGQHESTQGPIVFLTMEFVRGGDFSELIRGRNTVALETILDLLRQTLEGVQAAHAAGVIHRDLKPSNVLIDSPAGAPKRAVVTDFGLARVLTDGTAPPNSTLTQTNTQVGTLAYMSPEQLQGEPAAVKSDIYSLGLLMYEAVTGKRPFADGGPLASLLKRSTQTPAPPRQFAAELPPLWSSVILHCLNPDPELRPKSVLQVLEELDGRKAPPPRARRIKPTRRDWLWIGLGAAATAAVTTAVIERNSLAPMDIAAGTKLLLTHIAYPKEDPDLIGMTSLLANQLGQSAQIDIIDPNSVPELLQMTLQKAGEPLEPRKARQLALRLQVPLVLFGAVTRVGSEYVLNLSLERLGAGSELPQETRRKSFPAAGLRDLMDAAHEAARWVRQSAGELPATIQAFDRKPEEATTDSWDALRDFTLGETELEAMQRENALLAYESAIRSDPGFAMAWMRKGDVCIRLARSAEGYKAWQTAISLLPTRPLTKKENLRIRAMYATDTWDYEGSVELLKELSFYYPNDPYPVFYRAFPLMMLGRFSEAIEMLRRTAAANYRPVPRSMQIAMAHAANHDFSSARQALPALEKLNDPAMFHYVSALIDYSAGDYAESGRQLSESEKHGDEPWKSTATDYQGRLAVDTGRADAALKILSDGASSDDRLGFRSSQGQKLLSIAAIHQRAGRFSEVKAACLRALDLDPGPTRAQYAGSLLARSHFVRDAKDLYTRIDSSIDVPLFRQARKKLQGEIMLASHQTAGAITAFLAAAKDSPRALGREFLARAHEQSGAKKEALEAYLETLAAKPMVWMVTDPEPAGLWIDSLQAALRLAGELSDPRLPELSAQWIKATQNN